MLSSFLFAASILRLSSLTTREKENFMPLLYAFCFEPSPVARATRHPRKRIWWVVVLIPHSMSLLLHTSRQCPSITELYTLRYNSGLCETNIARDYVDPRVPFESASLLLCDLTPVHGCRNQNTRFTLLKSLILFSKFLEVPPAWP